MRTYIVMLHHTCDDLPVGVFSGRDGGDAETARQMAFAMASRVPEMPSENVRKIHKTACSTPVCVSVVEMRDGVPHGRTVAKSFVGEEVPA